jgi:hypothetical protein
LPDCIIKNKQLNLLKLSGMSRIIVDTDSVMQTKSVLELLEKNNIKFQITSNEEEKKALLLELDEILKQGPQRTDFEDFIKEFDESRKDRRII